MSWLQKLLPPKIKRAEGAKKSIPEGLWCKCPSCEATLYSSDLEKNINVCPKCGHHHRLRARARLDMLLDPEGRFEIGAEVLLIHYIDPLLSEVVPFMVLIGMLIVRPWGLLGTREELDRV